MALAETYQTRRAGRRIFPSGRATTRSHHLVPDAAGRTALDCELQWMPPEGRHGIQSPGKAAAGRRTQKRCPRHDMPSKMKTRRQTFHATGNAAPQKELRQFVVRFEKKSSRYDSCWFRIPLPFDNTAGGKD
jgi:hypothetical protein